MASTDPSIAALDPFSREAVSISQRQLITSDEERAGVAGEAAHLAEHGYVILEREVSGSALCDVAEALDHINSATRLGIYEFEGRHTHRAYNVVSRSRAFDELIMNRRVLAIIENYFGEAPQLSACMGMTLYEGQQAQPLHRDTGHYTLPWPRPPLEVNAIWTIDDFTESNGATRLMPGTHTQPGEERPDEEVVSAEASAGSVIIYDGSLWHGGGASSEAGSRRSVNNIYARQWLRQQDNMYLSMQPEEVLELPKLMQRLLGYWIFGFTLGVLDGRPPLDVLQERSASGAD